MTQPALNQSTDEQPLVPIDKSLVAEASSAHARINVPLNLTVWRDRPQPEQEELMWFHQHLLDAALSWQDACDAIGYDRSTVFRLLKGIYSAESWDKPIAAIRSYRKLVETRSTIARSEFAHNSISKLIWAGLDYAMANNSITTIIGESRQGKTIAAQAWCDENNHGRSVYVTAPAVGGTKMLMRKIAGRVGANKNQSIIQLCDSIYRAFNRNRILVVDEAHRLFPGDTRTINPASIELLRDIHDQTGCALAVIATQRFSDRLKTGAYQFEQFIGRIGMPIRLARAIKPDDVLPIIRQFLGQPSSDVVAALVEIANKPGRIGIVVETLKVASRMAGKQKEKLSAAHILRAIDVRRRMSGES
jgi:DNA transposition AAA+ family ATPase